MPVTITGKKTVSIEVTQRELASAIFTTIVNEYLREPEFDDAGSDWLTEDNTTFIGWRGWVVSNNAKVARLVDAANVLIYGKTLHPEAEEILASG